MELSLGKNGCASRIERTPSESLDSLSTQSLDSTRSHSSLSSHSRKQRAHRKKHDILAKVIILGESTVGKSCLTNRYVEDIFDFNSIATVGMDVRIKNIDMDGKILKVQIWDTAGQERYRGITKAFHRGANGALFVFDITNRESFQNLKTWMDDFETSTTAIEPVPMVVVGNKYDLDDKRVIEYEVAKEWCDYWDVPYFETSARTGAGVNEAFASITRQAAMHSSKRKDQKQKTRELQNGTIRKPCSRCIIS